MFDATENINIPEYEVSESYVYILRIKRSDGEVFYYVGSTSSSPEKRIKRHMTDKTCRTMPVERDGVEVLGDTSMDTYTIVGVEDIVPVESSNKERLLEKEREIAYRVAIEKGTTNVTGVQP